MASSLILCTGLLILILAVFLHVTRHFHYWKSMNIPYIKPFPFIGNAFNLVMQRKSIGIFLQEIYKSIESPCLGFFVFDQPFLLIRNLDLIKSVLVKDFDYFCDRSVTENHRDDKIGSSLLFVKKNPAWKLTRVKLTPCLSPGKIKNMTPLMNEVADEFVEYLMKLTTQESVEIKQLCKNYAGDVTASCAFGINSYSFRYENSAFSLMGQRVFDTRFKRSAQIASYFFAPFLVKPLRMKFIDALSSETMRNIVLESVSLREKSDTTRGDLIDGFIQMKKNNSDLDFQMDENELVAQAAVFFFAGYETTGATIAFVLYELSLHVDIQTKLREEMFSELEKYSISYEAIQEMTYLDMVVSETLRKYPPLPFLDRRCKQDYQLPNTDIVIKKGIPVYISIMGLHRDPTYFPNPDKFDPERFSPQNKSSIPAYAYLPFGEGPRTCIGAKFGLLSARLVLTKILTKFEVEPTKETPVPLIFEGKGATLTNKGGLYLKFKPLAHT